MNLKLKALGLGAFVAIATSASAAVNAGATQGGHFSFEELTMSVYATESTAHRLEFSSHGLEGGTICDESTYAPYMPFATTDTQIIVKPTYGKCHTTGDEPGTTTIDTKSCSFSFKVAAGSTNSTEQTLTLSCSEIPLTITHPNCTITILGQTAANAATYTRVTEGEKHAITVDVNAQFNAQYHGGVCIFTGTNHTATLKGYLTLNGRNAANTAPRDFTAT